MKTKIFHLLTMICFSQSMMAQESKPYLVTEGKQWAVCTYGCTNEYWTNTYRLQGDTTINGKTYKMEHESQEADLSDMRPSGRYMREENGKVYSITDKDKREELFFDYTMQIGDTLRYNPNIDYYGNVSDSYQCIRLAAVRDTVMPNGDGKVRKCYYVQSGWYDKGVYHLYEGSEKLYVFIEDIGFIHDGLSHPTIDITGSWSVLLYTKQNDTMLYQQEEGVVWRNSSNGEDKAPYLVTEGKEWAVYHHNPVCSAHQGGTITYKLQGDTILHGKTYKKRWMSYKEDLSDMQLCNTYMREEDGKVYTADAHGEQLWFDYTAQVGDTICFKEGYEYGRIQEIYDALLAETDSTKSYRCYRVQLGKSNGKASDVAFADQYISVCEDLGVIGSFMGYGLCEHRYNSYGRCSFSLLCVHDNGQILYQTDQGCYVPIPEQSRPTNRKGYGIYYGDNYLVRYTINEGEAINDTTDFSRWNDKTVIYFDVDSVGKNAFTNATFRQRRILYFTERLKYIAPDAFSNILMLDEEIEEEHPFGDLCIVFGGENPPAIEDNCIVNYADTTYRITYVVPTLETYIESDIQWTYSQLVTIDDFIKGYVAPENEVIVSDSASVDLDINVNSDSTNTDGSVTLYATARPKKEIPVRIGDKGSKDIISRAPAWMRYTIEVVMTDCQGNTLFAEKKLCNGYDACDFVVTLSHYPVGNIVNVYSRSIDQYGNASEWVMKKITLKSNEYEGDYVTDANVNLRKTADAASLTAIVDTDSIRITGYYSSNCGGGLYCGAIARGNNIELIFYDGAIANCFNFHYVDFTIPRFAEEIQKINVIDPFPLEVTVTYKSDITHINASDGNAPYYDLQGRKVAHPTRGIYIKDGKKVIVN